MPLQTFGAIFYYLHTTYRLHFWPKLSTPKSLNIKLEIFLFTFYLPGAQDKVFELLLYIDILIDVQTQMITFTSPPSDPEYTATPKTVQF